MPELTAGPSTSGSVVLELGPGTGVLVLHTPPELDGAEIEISACGGEHGYRTHSQVRQRRTAAGVQHAAVYPELAAGQYVIWRDDTTAVARVTICGSSVTTACWPGQADPSTPGTPGLTPLSGQ